MHRGWHCGLVPWEPQARGREVDLLPSGTGLPEPRCSGFSVQQMVASTKGPGVTACDIPGRTKAEKDTEHSLGCSDRQVCPFQEAAPFLLSPAWLCCACRGGRHCWGRP